MPADPETLAEPKFTLKQIVAVASIFSALSGAGGAATVMANDRMQDDAILRNHERIEAVSRQAKDTHETVVRIETQMEASGKLTEETRSDLKEIQRKLNQIIGELRQDR